MAPGPWASWRDLGDQLLQRPFDATVSKLENYVFRRAGVYSLPVRTLLKI